MYLFFFSGPPGCGKTTLAEAVARHYTLPLFCRDHLQAFLFKRNLIETNTVDGYLWILEQARVHLRLGVGCVLDAVFPRHEFREIAARHALETGAVFVPIYCYCSDKALWRSRWLSRAESNHESHWMAFSWADVERIEAQFEPWQHEAVIDLDAVRSQEENFHTLIQKVEAWPSDQ